MHNIDLQLVASEFWPVTAIGEVTKDYKDYNTSKENK